MDKEELREIISDEVYGLANQPPDIDRIVARIKEAGYRKVSGEPPVLGDDEMAKLWRLSQEESSNIMCEFDATELVMMKIARAQRDADVRYYKQELR